MGDTLKIAIQTKQELYTNSYKITINWGTIQVLEKNFYTKVSHIRRLTPINEDIKLNRFRESVSWSFPQQATESFQRFTQ